MDSIEKKVRDALKIQFTDEEIHFEHEPGEQILGSIVSEKFQHMDHEARQRLILNLLRAHLAPEERQGISGFFAYTPAEEKLYSEAYNGHSAELYAQEKIKLLEQKVKDILKLRFADGEIRFDHEPGERISGFIVSDKSLDMDHDARQEVIWNLLHAHLTQEERQQILGFLAYTLQEEKAYSEAFEYAD